MLSFINTIIKIICSFIETMKKNFVFSDSQPSGCFLKKKSSTVLRRRIMKHRDKMPLEFALKCFKRETIKPKQLP